MSDFTGEEMQWRGCSDPPEVMQIMVDLGMHLFLSEYAGVLEALN